MRTYNEKQSKVSKIVFIIIEILWLLMAAFTTYAGFRILAKDNNNAWFAWVYFVIAVICLMMFFFRRHARKKNQRKQHK